MGWYILGIAIFWTVMAMNVHEKKGYSWKKSFILAPFLVILGFIGMALDKDE